MIIFLILFILDIVIANKLISVRIPFSRKFIAASISFVFTTGAYYTLNIQAIDNRFSILQGVNHQLFLYFITLVVVTMAISFLIELLVDDSNTISKSSNPFLRIKYFFGRHIRYLQILLRSYRVGLFRYININTLEKEEHFAEALRKTLEYSGGGMMKFGQFLSTRKDLISPIMVEYLSKLQEEVEPTEFKNLRNLLPKNSETVFKFINEEPLATASIGQVHEAVLKNGTEVVIKFLKPDISKKIEIDLHILRRFSDTLNKKFKWANNIGINSLTQSFIQSLNEEIDFSYEIKNIQQIRGNTINPENKIKIPKVYQNISSSTLLVMEKVKGSNVRKVVKKNNCLKLHLNI